MSIIEVHNLSKSYGRTEAVKGLSFGVEEGELFGLIGPDGAGKTTLFRILTTLLKPDKGSVQVMGLDVIEDYRQIRPGLGYMPGRFALYQDLTVQENLEFFASVFGTSISENYELVKPIYSQLEPFKDRLAGALSGGMKQKLALSCALIHRPRVLLLDEPTTGVDAVSRREFWDILHNLRKKGITIVVSTPYMDEARRCDRIALIQNGTLMSVDTPASTNHLFSKPLLAVSASDKYRLIQELRNYEHTASVHPFGEFVHYSDVRNSVFPSELRKYLEGKGFKDVHLQTIEPGIEDTFMYLMEKEGSDE